MRDEDAAADAAADGEEERDVDDAKDDVVVATGARSGPGVVVVVPAGDRGVGAADERDGAAAPESDVRDDARAS